MVRSIYVTLYGESFAITIQTAFSFDSSVIIIILRFDVDYRSFIKCHSHTFANILIRLENNHVTDLTMFRCTQETDTRGKMVDLKKTSSSL